MGATEGLIAQIDQVIEYFNKRRMDLPDGFFDRKSQFVINGAPFETLLGRAPDDPLILMLARGPAGYRFTVKALQHAIPDAKIEKVSGPTDLEFKLLLKGTLRDTGDSINSLVSVTLRLTAAGSVEIASAEIDPGDLGKIRQARVSA